MRSMLALAALALVPTVSAQTTWYVDINGTPPGSGTVTDPYTSINYAVSQPSTISGDLVLVAPGTYPEQAVIVAKGVHVKSTGGPSVTIVDAGGGGSAVAILGTDGITTTLEGLTLTNGSGTGSPVSVGGGLYGESAHISVVNCVVEQNTARHGAGMFFRTCTSEVKNSTIRENVTLLYGHGGGVYVGGGSITVADCLVENNVAGPTPSAGYGGGLYASGLITVERTVVRGNKAWWGGGGLYATQGEVTHCRIEGNSGQNGGGVNGGSGLFIYDSALDGNIAESRDGSGHRGGGVFGPATLVRCTLANNRAWGNAGAAMGATLIECIVIANWATSDNEVDFAGGVFNCTLTDCTIARNRAVYNGGGFFPRGGGAAKSTLVRCIVFQNSAQGPSLYTLGGGIADCNTSFSTIYDNRTDGLGGGIVGGTTLHCTVVGNQAQLGAGGILGTTQGATIVQNSIIWNNGQEIRLAPNSTASVTYCDVKGGFPGTGNINMDPQFWNEAAQDFHLLATSPCIDAGDPLSPPDPDGSQADMGAFHYDPSYTGG